MQLMFERNWGWNEDQQKDEMFSSDSKYLVVRSSTDNEIIGFAHFQVNNLFI